MIITRWKPARDTIGTRIGGMFDLVETSPARLEIMKTLALCLFYCMTSVGTQGPLRIVRITIKLTRFGKRFSTKLFFIFRKI